MKLTMSMAVKEPIKAIRRPETRNSNRKKPIKLLHIFDLLEIKPSN